MKHLHAYLNRIYLRFEVFENRQATQPRHIQGVFIESFTLERTQASDKKYNGANECIWGK